MTFLSLTNIISHEKGKRFHDALKEAGEIWDVGIINGIKRHRTGVYSQMQSEDQTLRMQKL